MQVNRVDEWVVNLKVTNEEIKALREALIITHINYGPVNSVTVDSKVLESQLTEVLNPKKGE